MAFKEAKGGTTVSFATVDPGTVFRGYYTGTKSVTTSKGPSSLYLIRKRDGTETEFWRVASLERRMGEVPYGAFVQITYLGKKTTARGAMHDVKIEYDPDNSINVVQEPLLSASGGIETEQSSAEIPY